MIVFFSVVKGAGENNSSHSLDRFEINKIKVSLKYYSRCICHLIVQGIGSQEDASVTDL